MLLLGATACLGQATHLGIPPGQCVVLEGIVTSPTERKWTLYQGGVIQNATSSAVYHVPADRKLVLTDMKFTLRGQVGKGANVVLSAKQGIQNFQFFRLTVRLLTGLDQNVHSEHFTTPTVLAEGSELSVFLSAANGGVYLENCLLYGYFLPAGK
jgi:hypothetical protein